MTEVRIQRRRFTAAEVRASLDDLARDFDTVMGCPAMEGVTAPFWARMQAQVVIDSPEGRAPMSDRLAEIRERDAKASDCVAMRIVQSSGRPDGREVCGFAREHTIHEDPEPDCVWPKEHHVYERGDPADQAEADVRYLLTLVASTADPFDPDDHDRHVAGDPCEVCRVQKGGRYG